MNWKENLKKQLTNQEYEENIIEKQPMMFIDSEMRFDSNLLVGSCYYNSEDCKVYYFSGREWIEVANCSTLEE